MNPNAEIYGTSHNGLTNTQVGAMVGSIIAFTLITLGLIFYLISRRRQRAHDIRAYRAAARRPPPAVRTAYVDAEKAGGVRMGGIGVPRPARVVRREPEFIPGGPKYPTYKAVPIANPRMPQVKRKY